MYRQLLFPSLITISFITVLTKNISLASSTNNEEIKRECIVVDISKINKKANFFPDLIFDISGSRIIAKFIPQNQQKQALKLDDLAAYLGYKTFNWVNYVERDPYGIVNHQGQFLSIPYNDPPSGGYQYDAADEHPYYWDIEECENCRSRHHHQHPQVKQSYVLTFEDSPSDYRLKPGEKIEFVTHLVGIKINNADREVSQWEILSTFKWQLTNDIFGKGKVSLVAIDLPVSELSPAAISKIESDGGLIPTFAIASLQNQNNSHSLQCQRQSRQNRYLDNHL